MENVSCHKEQHNDRLAISSREEREVVSFETLGQVSFVSWVHALQHSFNFYHFELFLWLFLFFVCGGENKSWIFANFSPNLVYGVFN